MTATRTRRLHYDDPLRLAAEARVAAHATFRERPSVVLDETIFYPEAGGQMADRGALGTARVVDVQVDGDGVVHHVLEGELPAIGASVRCAVDGTRRREHMALHTGQHCLSRALLDELGAVTVSSRLGETACTIDVDRDGIERDALVAVEARVNALVDEDRPVRQFFPTDAELDTLALRKPPPETDRVRVVVVDAFDVTPCGGTHCTHTAQIELVWVRSVERYKGGSRITFTAGPRARHQLFERLAVLTGAAADLECAPLEVRGVVASLRGKLDVARAQAGELRAALAAAWAVRIEADATARIDARTIVATLSGEADLAQAIASRLAIEDRIVLVGAEGPAGLDVVVLRGPASTVSCGELLSRLAKSLGGRGGGRPENARGRLPTGTDLAAALGTDSSIQVLSQSKSSKTRVCPLPERGDGLREVGTAGGCGAVEPAGDVVGSILDPRDARERQRGTATAEPPPLANGD